MQKAAGAALPHQLSLAARQAAVKMVPLPCQFEVPVETTYKMANRQMWKTWQTGKVAVTCLAANCNTVLSIMSEMNQKDETRTQSVRKAIASTAISSSRHVYDCLALRG